MALCFVKYSCLYPLLWPSKMTSLWFNLLQYSLPWLLLLYPLQYATSFGISLEATLLCWKSLKEEVWTYLTAEQEVLQLEVAFHDHRWK